MNDLKNIIELFKILGFSKNINYSSEFLYCLIVKKQVSTPTYTDIRKVMYQTYWDTNKDDLVLVIDVDNQVTINADGIDMILEVLKGEFPNKKPQIREWQINKIIEDEKDLLSDSIYGL
jgi:hypothetical protein